MPTRTAIAIAITPTASDTRPPCISCAKTSRPMLSVPIGCASDGQALRARTSMYCGSVVWTSGPKTTTSTISVKITTPAMAPR